MLKRMCVGYKDQRCGELVTPPDSRCMIHQRAAAVAREQSSNHKIPKEQRGYDAAWVKQSKALRTEQPFCSICGHGPYVYTGSDGKTHTDDLTVDHYTPISDGGQTDDPLNRVVHRSYNSSRGSRGTNKGICRIIRDRYNQAQRRRVWGKEPHTGMIEWPT